MKNYLENFYLDNKIAFIFGCNGLIGTEICNALLDAKALVVGFDISKENIKLTTSKKMNFKNIYFDCGKFEDYDKIINSAISKYGCPDIVINSSYPLPESWNKKSFKELTFNALRSNTNLHMNSYAWLSKVFAELMVENKKNGSIIMLSSIYGTVGQDLNLYENTDMTENVSYALIKGGITNFTRLMASYYGKYKIRVNCISPGGILDEKRREEIDKVFKKNYEKKVPLKRFGSPKDVASGVLFLSSSNSEYITGTNLIIDGGYTAL